MKDLTLALEIVSTLNNYKGFNSWYYNIDDDIQVIIMMEMEEIIQRYIAYVL